MEIVEVTRTVSGSGYSNMSAKAILKEGDTVDKVGLELDRQLRNALNKIDSSVNEHYEKQREAGKTADFLKDALRYAEQQRVLPF